MVRPVAISLVIGSLVTALVLLTGGTAAACTCAFVDEAVLDASDGAYAGRVVEVRDGGGPAGADGRWYVATIEVEDDLKGNLPDTIHVRSVRDDGGNCGVSMRAGEAVAAVVQRRDGGELDTDACLRVPAEMLAAWTPPVDVDAPGVVPLGAGVPAPESSGSTTVTIAVVVGIVFVAAGIAVGVRQGRRASP